MPKLADAPPGNNVVSDAAWNELVREVRRLGRWNVKGGDFKSEPGGMLLDVRGGRSGFFPVKVEKTGGSDGDATTIASWTYTVRRQQWTGSGTSADFELGTVMAPVKPRPKGPMIFQADDTGYGVGFYDESGNFQLWD